MSRVRPLVFAMALLLATGLVVSKSARAQEEPAPAAGEGSGRSLDGYFATSFFAGLAMFIICKSARR